MIGQTISHYKILEKLGEGGMGVVYKAHDTKLDRIVALKFLPPYLGSDANEKERFYHEAKAASTLLHTNVAVMFEVNEHKGRLFLAMEYVEGRTLKKLVEEREPLPVKKVLDIAIQICDGLAAAHEKGVVHRDIKSDNMMITQKGQIKIMDFGLAKMKGASKLTKAGSTLGTAAYMSPEQAQGEEVDQRSDIFSVGVVLYELLTGKLPFRGEHHAALMYSLINEDPQPIARFNEKVSPDFERVVEKALAKHKDERYQHVDDMLADLRRERKNLEYVKAGYVKASTTVTPAPLIHPQKTRTNYFIAGTAIAIVIVAMVAFNPLNLNFGAKRATEDRKSVAVLPFINLGDNEQDESFSDGMTEDILTQLSKIGDLKVVSRSSIMRYKGTQKKSQEIGRELGVASILQGSIRRRGNRIRITGQLIDASTDEQIWADSYDREMKDVFDIQSEVAKSIARALHAKLSASEEANIEKKPTENVEAYGFYTRGRQYYYLYHRQDNERAIELFKKALELDPNYALAYSGLGDCYGQRASMFGFTSNWVDSGIVASEKAISLDPNLAEGYKSLGLCYEAKGMINRALDAYFKSVERNPNYTPAVGNISLLNFQLGNFVEAYRWATKEAKLSAVEPFTFLGRGAIYAFLTEDEKAEHWFNKSLDLQPDFVFALLGLSGLSIARGDIRKAREYVDKSLTLDPDNPICLNFKANVELFAENYDLARRLFVKVLPQSIKLGDFTFRSNATGLGFSLLKLGKLEEGKKYLAESRSQHMKEVESGRESAAIRYELAAIAAVEGKKSEGIDWLQKAVNLGWRDFRSTQSDPMLQSVHQDQRFTEIIADMRARVEEQRKLVLEMEKQ
ncbi:MAG: protein kinase [Ignavibacteriales bacterium]|nr:protein kinase [Ignavibacteriales bacterium]